MAIRMIRRYKSGELRVKKWFAWLPVTCRATWDDRERIETRWLQTVYVVQQYHASYYSHWSNIEFVGEQEYAEQVEKDREILNG